MVRPSTAGREGAAVPRRATLRRPRPPAPRGRMVIGRIAASLATMTGLCLASSGRAETTPDRFGTFLASGTFKSLLKKARATLPAPLACPTAVEGPLTYTISTDITFTAKGVPATGAWWARYPVSGCGNDTIINIYFLAEKRGGIRSIVALPGTTRADIILQHDAVMYAFIAVGTRMPHCANAYVVNTAYEAPGPVPDSGRRSTAASAPLPSASEPWWETWTVAGCGRTFRVPLEFEPDSTGTTINQRPSLITEQ